MKKVSVIIPAFNKARLTVAAVESVLAQTYGNIEIIVVDDGSIDDTYVLLSRYSKKIKYLYKKNGGACSARNLGIKVSSGEYIALLDCDDAYLPKKLEVCVDYLEKRPELGFVYTVAYFIDEKNNILRTYPRRGAMRRGCIAKALVLKNFIPNSTVVLRRKCLEKSGLFDESVFVPADWDLWLRLAENYKTGYIGVPYTKYMISGSYTLRNIQQSEREEFIILEKAFFRRQKQNSTLRKKAMSYAYMRSAVNYFIVGDFSLGAQKLVSSIRLNLFNLKILCLFIYFFFNKKGLKIKLRKLIFNKTSLNLN